MKYRFYKILPVPVIILLCSYSAFSQTVKVEESNQDHIVLEIHFPEGFLETMLKDNIEYSDANVLYTLNKLIGLPQGKKAEVSMVEGEPYTKNISGELWERISELDSPENIADIRSAGGFRGLQTASLTINPVIFDSGNRSARYYNSISIVITFADTEVIPGSVNLNDKHQPMIDKLLNGNDVTEWLKKGLYNSAQMLQKTAADTAAWFEPGVTYYKLIVNREGLYTINLDYLVDSLDISQSLIVPQNIKIYNKGSEIPLYVFGEDDGNFNINDYVVFYGDINRGEDSYYDLYTDDNAYWLTFEGGPGLRMEVVDGTPDIDAPELESFTDTLHYEYDEDYFHGLDTPGIENTRYVAGERWAWQRFSSRFKLTRDFGFASDDKLESEDPVTLRFALTGFTAESEETTDRHHVEFHLNGQLVYDVVFYGSADTVLNVTVVNDLVNSGNNTITITSIQSNDGKEDGFYLDWFEVIYEHLFTAANNSLAFSLNLSENASITIDGFSVGMPYFPEEKKCVFNITQSSVDTNISFGGNSSNYFIEFNTSDIGLNKYMILDMFEPHLPNYDSKIEFQNLWDSNNAADYLIITHEKFINQANSYASYRQEMDNFPNGIKLVDVEDVYNQFNYGMKDPRAIRDFLTRTRDWNVMPSFVLLLGDASWDPKLNDPESENIDYVPAYGYPASDAWYTLTDGEDDIIPDIYIGRFPVASTEEFENIFNKIQEYESVEP
ncbi:MAG: hypothetical protein GY863_07640, partial [bacterium]|nr:hypothetical protein [bacterium]